MHDLYFRVASKRSMAIADLLSRRNIGAYCIPAKDKWCAVIHDKDSHGISDIMEATAGFALEIAANSAEKSQINIWYGQQKAFWVLFDERETPTYRPDHIRSLHSQLTGPKSPQQFLKEMTQEELEEKIKGFSQLGPEKACQEFLELMDVLETKFPAFAEIDQHFENAASKNKMAYWIQS